MMNLQNSADYTDGTTSTLSVRKQLTLSVLWFSLNFVSAALVPIVLPVQIALFVAPGVIGSAQQAAALGWLSTLGAIISLLIPPLVGTMSDRTRGPLGRRRPYVAIGALLLVFSATVLAAPRDVVVLLAGLILYQLGSNVCTTGYQGLIPDLVPETQRGEASGYMGIMTIAGNAASIGLAAVLLSHVANSVTSSDAIVHGSRLYYLITGVVLAAGAGVTLIGIHESPLPPLDPPPPIRQTERQLWRHALRRVAAGWLEPLQHRDYRWVFLTRCSVMLGLSLFMTFIEYYLANVAHVTNFVAETAAVAVLALLGAACSAFTLGMFSDRVGRVALVCFASACMSLAALSFMVLPVTFPLWPLGLLFGVGYGAYTSVDWALAVDVLPSANSIGKDMGIWTIATTLPAILAPGLGGIAISLASVAGSTASGYRAVFALAAAFLVAGAVFILMVRESLSAKRSRGQERRGVDRRGVAPGWRLALRARSGRARGFLLFWPFWERVMSLAQPAHPIPGTRYDLLRIHFTRHKGRPIILPDGTQVNKGDRLAEIHINNRALVPYTANGINWKVLAMLAADLRALSRWADDPAFPANIHAFYGFTLLGNGARRLGFTLRDRPHTIHTRLDRFFLMGLMVLYSSGGVGRLRSGTTYSSYPVEVWMSPGELRRRYGPRASAE